MTSALLTKLTAMKSTSCAIAKSMSSQSLDERTGSIAFLARSTPPPRRKVRLALESTSPGSTTRARTSGPALETTSRETMPPSTTMASPGSTSSTKPSYDTPMTLLSCAPSLPPPPLSVSLPLDTSRTVKVNSAPTSALRGFCSSPVCTSDPSVSTMIATEYPFSLLSLRIDSITPECHSCEPWHMLSRATFIPPAASSPRTSGEQEAGPMVQMILVRRVERKPLRFFFFFFFFFWWCGEETKRDELTTAKEKNLAKKKGRSKGKRGREDAGAAPSGSLSSTFLYSLLFSLCNAQAS